MKSTITCFLLCVTIWQSKARVLMNERTGDKIDVIGLKPDWQESCMHELNVDNKTANIYVRSAYINKELQPDYNKFFRCYCIKAGYLDEQGNIKYDNLIENLIQGVETNDIADVVQKEVIRGTITKAVDHCRKDPPPPEDDILQFTRGVVSCVIDNTSFNITLGYKFKF